MTTSITRREDVPAAMAWMIGLSVVLFWLPVLGGLIAGFVGGRKAGSVRAAVVAVVAPGILLFLLSFFLGALFGWIPIVGPLLAALAGVGQWVLSFMSVIPLLLGAVVGGMTR